jgi:diguanylate cyclase
MLKDFFSNIGIVTAFLFFTSQLFKRSDIYQAAIALRTKFVFGIVNGCYGIVIMYFGLHIPPHSLFDLRHLFILVAASMGGLGAAMTSAVVMAAGRVLLFGGINLSSIMAIAGIVAIALIAGIVFELKNKGYWLKWTVSLLGMVVIIVVSVAYLLAWSEVAVLLAYYLPAVLVGGIFAATLVRFLATSNQLYLKREMEATTDFLTGLNNVRSFDTIFNEMAKQVSQKGGSLSLLMIDIDYFKQVNDRYGHGAGDAVLRQMSNVLKDAARSFDIVSRNGGEEFSMLLPDCPRNYSSIVAEKIRRTVEKHEFRLPDGSDLHLTVSVGIANFPGVPMHSLIVAADEALYEAKYSGRNRHCVYRRGKEVSSLAESVHTPLPN